MVCLDLIKVIIKWREWEKVISLPLRGEAMQSASIEAKAINQKLLEAYGKHLSADKANFRVVWSEDQLEKRFGVFNVYYNDMFVREETGIREVAKYEYLDHQWVVERMHPNYHKDVMEGSYVYEPLWAFPRGLPLKWEAVDYCVKMALKMIPIDYDKRTPQSESEAIDQDEKRKAKEVRDARTELDNVSNPSELELRLKDGDAVSMAGKKFDKGVH